MNDIAKLFYDLDEPYAAGLFEEPDKGYFYRHALALARWYEHLPIADYEPGESLYPRKNKFFRYDIFRAARPQFALTYTADIGALEKKSPEAAKILSDFTKESYSPGGWTHGAPNYKRILAEGLASYRDRVLKRPKGEEFREGLLQLLNAMENYMGRAAAYLRSVGAPEKLVKAVEKVPFAPAENLYEALVSWNLIFYFDGADNLGCLDDGLAPYWNGEDYTDIIGELFDNIDAVGTWSCTIGPNYSPITEQSLRAIYRRRRPLLELMLTPDMPDDLWEIALENIRAGSCNPSFYNTSGIHDMLKDRFSHIPDSELALFCGCGCTETNLQGLTRAGGTDDNLPLLELFRRFLFAHLTEYATFEEFYEAFCQYTEKEADEQLDRIIGRYEYMAERLPNPMRTLFFDDCIEKGKDFNGGGARYTWTQSSDSGLINTADSLLALRELVFRQKKYTAQEFLDNLAAEDPMFYTHLRACPCFGTDNEEADLLAADYAKRVYAVFRNKKPHGFIDAYILTEHQFLRYEGEGARVGSTPDGRRAGEPTCDSIAALRGKAIDGPTAMLKSAARLPQHMADGISVLNLTISKDFVGQSLRQLIETYFAMGGIQVQVTCTSVDELKDAMEHPEKHRDLIVRVGGYSDYFVNLSPALRKTVLERNLHALGE